MSCKSHVEFYFQRCTQNGGDCRHLKFRQYEEIDLTKGVVMMLNAKTKIQRSAIDDWDELTKKVRLWNKPGGLRFEYFENSFGVLKLSQIFEIFDDFFFRGMLRQFVSIGYSKFHEYRLGYTGPPRDNKVKITIYKPRAGTWNKDRFQTMMQTMLHEMAHALWTVFLCHNKPGCGSLASHAVSIGVAGHGPTWRALYTHMLKHANKHLRPLVEPWGYDRTWWNISVQEEVKTLIEHVVKGEITRKELSVIQESLFAFTL